LAPRPVEEDPDEDGGDEEEVDFLEGDDDAWTEEVAEGARTHLTDEEYERAIAPEPPVGWIIAVVILAVLAVAVLVLR
jgi:hypothetical protein